MKTIAVASLCLAGLGGVAVWAGTGSLRGADPGHALAPNGGGAGHAGVPALRDGHDLAAIVNRFAIRTAMAILKERPGQNLLIAPLNVATAHSMLYAGTRGDTKKQLEKILGYEGIDEAALHHQMHSLLARVTAGTEGAYETAQAYFLLMKAKVKPDFKTVVKQNYDAELRSLPGCGKESVDAINAWVAGKTHGMIRKAIDQLPVPAGWALVSASAFWAEWDTAFNPSNTAEGAFHKVDGQIVYPPFMVSSKMSMRFVRDYRGMSVVELPYKGREFSMVLVIPGDSVARQSAADRLESDWPRIWSALLPGTARVVLPSFTWSDSHDLSETLPKLADGRLFDPLHCDLSGVTDVDAPGMSWVGLDIHRTFIEVDEKGTRAAASTAIVSTLKGIDQTPVFRADRPFLYAIVHRQTGVIVFLGVCFDPTQKN